MRRAARAATLAAGATLALAACRGDRPAGVPVGTADDAFAVPAPARPDPADTLASDTLALAPDTLAAPADTLAVVPPPEAGPAWDALRAAVRAGQRDAWDDLTRGTAGADRAWAALAEGPFRDGLLALTARDLLRDGTAREARVTVGYDAAGRVVPQDEAETDRTLALRLDVVRGAYRVVAVEVE